MLEEIERSQHPDVLRGRSRKTKANGWTPDELGGVRSMYEFYLSSAHLTGTRWGTSLYCLIRSFYIDHQMLRLVPMNLELSAARFLDPAFPISIHQNRLQSGSEDGLTRFIRNTQARSGIDRQACSPSLSVSSSRLLSGREGTRNL